MRGLDTRTPVLVQSFQIVVEPDGKVVALDDAERRHVVFRIEGDRVLLQHRIQGVEREVGRVVRTGSVLTFTLPLDEMNR